MREWVQRKDPEVTVRRALTVGVARFDRHERLEFAAGLVHQLGATLSTLDYDVREFPTQSLHGKELGELVTRSLETGRTDDLSIVHLVSHGECADGSGTVFVLGSDGGRHGEASIAHWLTMQQNTDSPTTLFFLDLCAAGISARLPWQAQLEGSVRGWVIAACGPREAAYDGRFTRAVTNVLQMLQVGALDIDPGTEFVSLRTVARAIRQEVNRLTAVEDGFHQQVTASLLDISSADEPPFFPNPAYRRTARLRLRAKVDSGVLPFLDDLDEGLDARHFVERATGLGGLADSSAGVVGCFTGRDRELRRISPWLSGHGDSAPLCVVTGSPGAGKSALLGVLVCAASRLLREATEPIWNRVAQAPVPIDELVAVHARQRGLAGVASSIARQLGLPESLTTDQLVTALRVRGPVVVVDALDEADDPVRVMNELLLPLIEPGDPVRLLVGVRRYDDFAPLFDRATMVDLDEVEQVVLENDLFDYVMSLLRATSTYRARGGVSGEFASAVSAALAAPGQSGPFLVAGLYTRHFVTGTAVTAPSEAAALGRKVPSDLRGVLDLDLELQRDQPWLRPVMTTLAHARGAGMPVSLLTRVAPVFAEGAGRPAVAEIRAALKAGKFYLRQSLDSDHSNVYRLFHQGLADTLASGRQHHLDDLLDAILSRLGPPDDRDWDAAEPYLFRHIADHAADANRVDEIETDPGLLLHPRFSGTHRFAGITDQAELALTALRAGLPEVARRAANVAGRAPLTWQPRWVVGSPGPPATVESIGRASAVTISAQGSDIVAVGPGGFQSWRWPHGQTPVTDEITTSIGGDLVAFSPTSEVLVVRGRAVFRRWTSGYWWAGSADRTIAAATPHPFEPDFLCATTDGTVVRLHPTGECTTVQDTGLLAESWTIGVGPEGAVVLAREMNGHVRRFDDGQRTRLTQRHQVATACAISQRGQLMVTGTADGSVHISRPPSPATDQRFDSGVRAVAVSPDDTSVAVGCQDGSVHLMTLSHVVWSGRLSTAPIIQVALSNQGARMVAVDAEGTVHHAEHGRSDVLSTPPSTSDDTAAENRSIVTEMMRNDRRIFVGVADGRVAGVDRDTGTLEPDTLRFDRPVRGLALTTVGNELALLAETADGIHLYGDGTAEVPLVLEASSTWAADHFQPTTPSPIVAGGRLVQVTTRGGLVLVSELDSTETSALGEHPGCRVAHTAYIATNPLAFTGGTDGTVRIWDLDTCELTYTIHIGRPVWKINSEDTMLLVAAGGELLRFDHVSARSS